MKTISITVKGKVQGVGFRYFVMRHAIEIGVYGYVKNLPNGDVYIQASGTSSQLENLILLCHKGPSHSKVESVLVENIEHPNHFQGFQIVD